MFWLMLAVIVLAFAMRVREDSVVFWFLPDWPLPQSCASRAWFNIECPGCGLTRSFIHLAHGQWQAAWRCHRLGPLLALMTVLQVPYRLLCMSRGSMLTPAQGRWVSRVLIFLLLANWAAGQLALPAGLR